LLDIYLVLLSGSYGIHASVLCREQLQILVVFIPLSIENIQIYFPMITLIQGVTTHELRVDVSMQEGEIGHGNEMFNDYVTFCHLLFFAMLVTWVLAICLTPFKSGRRNPRRHVAGRLSFLLWRLIHVGSWYGTCFMSPFCCLEFSGAC